MKITIILILITSVNFSVSYSQSGWLQQTSGTTDDLFSVYFVNSNTGWAAGTNGRIIKTTNGGVNWFSQNTNTILNLREISFANQSTGWAVGGNYDNNPDCYDVVAILKTLDGGTTWMTDMSGYGYIFNDLCVTDENTAFVSNKGVTGNQFCNEPAGKVAKTIKDGTTWNTVLDGAGFNSVYFINSLTGWALSEYRTDVPPSIYRVLKSTNGGMDWVILRTDATINIIDPNKKIRFLTETIGYMIFNSLVKTTDGGFSWSSTDDLSTSNINSYHFINPNTGWCVGSTGRIIKTNNGGSNWIDQTSKVSQGLRGIHFVNSNTGWIVGAKGTILKTATGGVSSVSNPNTVILPGYILHQNYPNPFNPKTIINYELGTTDYINLKVYNSLGNEIAILVSKKQTAGNYSINFDGSNFPNGVYYYSVEAGGNRIDTKRMLLVK